MSPGVPIENAAELLKIESSGVPIYVQIRDQILQMIGTGVLKPRQQMPTMRQVAVTLRVDLNTVRHAYDELARTGAVQVVRARGTYVADNPNRAALPSKSTLVNEIAQRSIALAAEAGASPVAVARRILQMVNGDKK